MRIPCQLHLMIRYFLWLGGITILLMDMSACKEKKQEGGVETTGVVMEYDYDEIYNEFVLQMEEAVNKGDAVFFNEHFDAVPLVDEIVKPIKVNQSLKDGFRAGLQENLDVGEQIINSLGQTGHYKFLHLQGLHEAPSAIFRLVAAEGINYHELSLELNEQGKPRVKDFYIYMGGIKFSQTIQRLFTASLTELEDTNFYQSLPPDERAYINHTQEIDEIAELVTKSRHKDALKKIDELPQKMLEDKMIQIMRINVAHNIDEKTYKAAVTHFKTLFPEDAVVELMQLDFALLDKKYPVILRHIDSLELKIGGDPYLYVMRADIYRTLNKLDTTELYLRKCLDKEPELEPALWSLVDVLLSQERYQEAVDLFEEIKDLFNVNPAEFVVEDGYKGFWDSEPYKKWEITNPLDSAAQEKLKRSLAKEIDVKAIKKP